MKYYILLFVFAFSFWGCDSVYRYIFLPPERIEYTLIPDKEAMEALKDTNYFISKSGQVVGYDERSWKIEIRYMSDYQLNTFEFPEESKAGIFSGNPFTYGNWIDPTLGYTPKRFTVFKVTIYNYTALKLNFDPEMTLLQTDRGDNFNAYAREQKNAKYLSIEEYFKKRKGTSGIDEEVFETRMGIARRTMLYYGKPIYKGDSRDGLVVYDPIVDKVERLKISIPNFIIGYDENNEPSDFISLSFFFKQVPLDKATLSETESIASSSDTASVKSQQQLTGSFRLAQIKYVDDARASVFTKEKLPQIKEVWDPSPKGISNLINHIKLNTGLKTSLNQITIDELHSDEYELALLTGVGASPMIEQYLSTFVEYIQKGGFLVFDISTFREGMASNSSRYFQMISEKLKGNVALKNLSIDHPIFNSPQKLSSIPSGYETVNPSIETTFQLRGIFLEGKLVALETGKSYSMLWEDEQQSQALDFGSNLAAYSVTLRKK